ncbi:MAG: Eco57I restriction-modification methylase domain-containing protein [Deltaproteobacteria bacterium]|nr:Eco57I restriction-modification methylase domain-containing protein [Deltaproteobacteria bacterium]
MAKGLAENETDEAARLRLAQAVCGIALNAYWKEACRQHHCTWEIRPIPCAVDSSSDSVLSLADGAGFSAAAFPPLHAGYLLSSLYTVMLPDTMRSTLGAYYTPPALVERLLDMVTEAGFDWEKGRILDPACGGGAFLAPVAVRMFKSLDATDPAFVLRNIATRLHGFEIDPFAAWVSMVLLETVLLPVCLKANKRLPDMIETRDSLISSASSQKPYDLIIGNPPYGKITLPDPQRQIYKRSLYGHANLYGLFTDLAVRLVKPSGLIGYVTPTSFLGGQYFKALRALMKEEAPPVMMDFVTERQGVFEDVLQETMLTVYKRADGGNTPVSVHFLKPNGEDSPVRVQEVGKFKLPFNGEEPWFLPRDPQHAALLNKLIAMPHRLADYGFCVNTGQLVWNRHKGQLREDKGKGCYPLVWAESVTAEGRFSFSAVRRNHTPYFHVHRGQDFLITRESCVLVQRTTAKEQRRRLIAALLPEAFVTSHGGVVVENHINMIKPIPGKTSISPATIAVLLNTRALDLAFRCISGSVAVSAYELNLLPLPSPEQIKEIETLVEGGAPPKIVENLIARIYGVEP